MFEYVDFKKKQGKNKEFSLKILALSTCTFCKQAMQFLEGHDSEYEYIYFDNIDRKTRHKIRDEFKTRFDDSILYPSLIINDMELLAGFDENVWREKLGL